MAQESDSTSVGEFICHSLQILADVVLGMVCGVLLDSLVVMISNTVGLTPVLAFLLQLLGICIVLYALEESSNYLTSSWRGEKNYGIVFITVFFASQANIMSLINWVALQEHRLV